MSCRRFAARTQSAENRSQNATQCTSSGGGFKYSSKSRTGSDSVGPRKKVP